MYARVLVPLDGSDLAESILPIALKVATPLDAELILLRVVEPISPAEAIASAGAVTPDTYALREMDAKRYLLEVERRLAKQKIHVRTRIALGAPAEAIVAAARTTGAELIAMTTHGRSGFGRVLFGSVAEAVLRAATVPVLIARMTAKSAEAAGAAREP